MAKVISKGNNVNYKKMMKDIFIGIVKFLLIIFTFCMLYYVSCIFMNNNKAEGAKNIKTEGFFDIPGIFKGIFSIDMDKMKEDLDKIDFTSK